MTSICTARHPVRAHPHHRPAGDDVRRAMTWALGLTAAFALAEAAGGWWSGSLALLSDAGHMITDSLALGLALFAQTVARRPPSERNSFGYARAEALGAFVNAVFMLLVVALIVIEAVQRLLHPAPVEGGMVMVIAVIGLGVNLVVARMLHNHHDSMNSRAAYLHVLSDMLGSVAALLAGAIIWWTRLAARGSAAVGRRLDTAAGLDLEAAQAVGQRPDGRRSGAPVVSRHRPGAGRHPRRGERP